MNLRATALTAAVWLWVLNLSTMAGAVTSPDKPTAATNVFTPGELWLDENGKHVNAHGGGVLQFAGVWYWFGEHKVEGPAGNNAQVGVHVYSSTNLYQWRHEGIALAVSTNQDEPIHRGCILERPKVIYNARTKKFVMWFHLELRNREHPGYSSAYAGVATADAPTGPYIFQHAGRLNYKTLPLMRDVVGNVTHPDYSALRDAKTFDRDYDGGQMARDCTLFVDDDGHAYFIASSEENRYLHFNQLTDDFTEANGIFSRFNADEMAANNEAPAVFKKNGKYYLIASGTTGWNPNPARSFVSDSIWGPWQYLGNPCRGVDVETRTTFESQPTAFLAVPAQPGQFIYLGDRWRPRNAIDGRYIWLPVEWENGKPVLHWYDKWDLTLFDKAAKPGK